MDWSNEVFEVLLEAGVGHVGYVPDAGLSGLIRLAEDRSEMQATVCTTEEESLAIACGAWLGGLRSVVLMQSSGVGNCINMLSLPVQARAPLLMLVTMRGEWAEFNPWQQPMGLATETCLEAIGVQVSRVERATDLAPTVRQACTMAYDADQQIAVLLSQRLLGEKTW